MVAGPGEDLKEMITRLEQQELDCQVVITGIDGLGLVLVMW